MKGTKKEIKEFTPKIGWAEAFVVAINPDNSGLEKLGYTSGDDEPIYSDEKKDVDNQRIDIFLQELKSGYKFKKSFWLENENTETKPEDGSNDDDFVKKSQYVNQVGESFWAASKKDLPEWFTNFRRKEKGDTEFTIVGEKLFRIAKRGEAGLMDFVRKWLSFNYYDPQTNILLDMKKIFNGDFRQLIEQVGGEFALVERHGKEEPTTVVELLQVKEVDDNGEHKTYQTTWKTTLSGFQMKSIRNVKFTEENIAKWKQEQKTKDNPKGRYLKDWEKLAIDVSTGEYKSKNHYSFDLMRDYTGEEENFTASSKTVTGVKKSVVANNDDDADY